MLEVVILLGIIIYLILIWNVLVEIKIELKKIFNKLK